MAVIQNGSFDHDCDECGRAFSVPSDAVAGEVFSCPDCGVDYELQSLPDGRRQLRVLVLEAEDWGE